MDASAHFKGKKITVMGLGLLGRGVGDARYLAEQGAELIVTDLKSAEALAPSLAELKDFPNIQYMLGEHKLEDFQGRDLILKAAGVPLDSIYIAEAKKNEISVRMSADLFAEISGVECIGVTGTRGKSTTTHLIAAILEAAGKRVLLGGNVRGVSTLALLDDVQGGEVAVMELDSWQCQGWGEAGMSPHIAVFTTFYPDHLNYYGSTSLTTGKSPLDAYLADKANIFLNQIETDTFILGSQAAAFVREKYQDEILADLVIASEDDIAADWKLQIPGEHNRYDAGLALMAARAAGVEDAVSRAAIENFKGVPGRLELIAEKGGVKYYNDTTATTPEATLAAIDALAPRKDSGQNQNLILILGGADKNLDMNKLLLEVPKRTKRVILLAGTGTSRILEFLPGASVFDTLRAAVDEAVKAAQPGDSIILSPAFASFGMFKNEYDRGDQFNAIVKAYA
jgi:UDP-N-acetylmuramoylalanine--D-glutamate ligase